MTSIWMIHIGTFQPTIGIVNPMVVSRNCGFMCRDKVFTRRSFVLKNSSVDSANKPTQDGEEDVLVVVAGSDGGGKESVITATATATTTAASAFNLGFPVAKFQQLVSSLPPVTTAASAFNLGFPVAKFQQMVSSLPPVNFTVKRPTGTNFAIWLCVGMAVLFVSIRAHIARKSRNSRPGSVADLVRRGQLRSDRRGISSPLQYEDPFNNPMVKVGKQNSTVEMCGKVYRLAPVTLTNEQQAIHQRRRSRAYEWKRPTIFLKEGDTVPPDVDPDTVRWIPANHPFATTSDDIDEDLAQTNVYQKRGVPFRIRAEHEALQKKLEALQNGQKLNKLGIDANIAKDFERPYRSSSKGNNLTEEIPSNNKAGKSRSDSPSNSSGSNADSEEAQK